MENEQKEEWTQRRILQTCGALGVSSANSGRSFNNLSNDFSTSFVLITVPQRSERSLDVISLWLAFPSNAKDTASTGTPLFISPRFKSLSISYSKKKKKDVIAYSLILFWKKKSKLYPYILSPCFEIIREAVTFWWISFYYLIQKTNSLREVSSLYSPYSKHRKMYLLKIPKGVTK